MGTVLQFVALNISKCLQCIIPEKNHVAPHGWFFGLNALETASGNSSLASYSCLKILASKTGPPLWNFQWPLGVDMGFVNLHIFHISFHFLTKLGKLTLIACWPGNLKVLFDTKCQIMTSQGSTTPKWMKWIFFNFKVKLISSERELEGE